MVLWRKRYVVALDVCFGYRADPIAVPSSFCTDAKGYFYFSDQVSRRTVKLDISGHLLATFDVAPSLKCDEDAMHKWFGMCVSPSGCVIHCWSETDEGLLVKYDEHGRILNEMKLSDFPFEIRSDGTGALWVGLYYKKRSSTISYIIKRFSGQFDLQGSYMIPQGCFRRDTRLLIGPGDSENLFFASNIAPFSMWGLHWSSHKHWSFDDISSILPNDQATTVDGEWAGDMIHFSDIVWYTPLKKVLLLHTKGAIYFFEENGKFSGVANLPVQIYKLCCDEKSNLFGFQLGDTSYVHRLIVSEENKRTEAGNGGRVGPLHRSY